MVIWADPAKSDLRAIHNFIASDSKYYARKVVQDIIDRTNILEEYPGCGLKFWHHASPLRFDLSGTKNSRHLAAGKCLLKIDF